ncbi:MAG: hypothetical protein Q7J14_01435 [Candidatus Magasanikbacteria bacterium]|nr:hypothetical protein [Candidatus Magasanikbacteria bacterium]
MDENPIKTSLTVEQKFGFVFLLIFAILFLVLSFFQLRNNLYRPYALTNSVQSILIQENFSDPTEAHHYRDTYKDGLNDFEEIYVYGTSAYLDDTDSDGVNDKDEISQGRNPVCAEGTACDKQNSENIPSQTLESWIKNPEPETMLISPEQFLNNPEELKKLLIASGIEESLLAGLTDEEIKAIGEEIFNSVEFESALNTQISDISKTTSSTVSSLTKEQLFADSALLRQALLDTGYVDKEALDKLTDEEVKKAAELMLDFSE